MNECHATHVRQANSEDLEFLVPLFNAYREFYRQPSDPHLARSFLQARLENRDAVILPAGREGGSALGFTQLFPSFSSLGAARIFILNDLFVVPSARRTGVGSQLLRAAAEFARCAGAIRLTLSTEVTNKDAQALYEAEGWTRQTDFFVYNQSLRA